MVWGKLGEKTGLSKRRHYLCGRMKAMKKISLVVAAAVMAGCATVAKQTFSDPVVSFRDLRLEGVGLTGGALDVILGIYNPNGYRLDANRMTYRLMVDTTAIGEGIYDRPFHVDANDSTTVQLPVTLDYAGLSAAGKQLLGKGAVNYRVVGDVTVATPLGSFTLPYSQTGRFTTFGGGGQH
jgi:LEA14-like dessication related protein